LDERDRQHDIAIADKADAVEDLQRRLADSQRKLTEALVDAAGMGVSGAGRGVSGASKAAAGRGPGPLEEICKLRTALAEATHARDEQDNKMRDLGVRMQLLSSIHSG